MTTGKALIFSAPSGSGKTTIVKHLLNNSDRLAFSISACTRVKREAEVPSAAHIATTAETRDCFLTNLTSTQTLLSCTGGSVTGIPLPGPDDNTIWITMSNTNVNKL